MYAGCVHWLVDRWDMVRTSRRKVGRPEASSTSVSRSFPTPPSGPPAPSRSTKKTCVWPYSVVGAERSWVRDPIRAKVLDLALDLVLRATPSPWLASIGVARSP